jgi:type I restriction enzyme M protein
MPNSLIDILKDSDYRLTLFATKHIEVLQKQITEKSGKFYVNCLVRKKEIKLTPEEVVRQLYLKLLLDDYLYPEKRIRVEFPVTFGSDSSKRADIAILDKDSDIPFIIVVLKKPKQREGKAQLRSYCNASGAPIGVWTNGDEIEYWHRKDPNTFDELENIPTANQKLKDIFNERFTILELVRKDKLKTQTLQSVIKDFENEVLANSGADVFEEAFKLIFTKLYDETKSAEDKKAINYWLKFNKGKTIENFPKEEAKNFRNLQFRNTGVEVDTFEQISSLFENAKEKWEGIFSKDSKIELTASHLQTCVSYLQDIKLFNSNMEVVDDAFEYLVNKEQKGNKGQYFTPRYVIDMCVKMLNPQPDEYMIDTAAGSCGFPVHTIFYVWKLLNPEQNPFFTLEDKTEAQKEYVQKKIFALDFDKKAVRVGRTLNLIAGDGETNVLQINSLDYERWENDFYNDKEWRKNYSNGFENLQNLKANSKNGYKHFKFDVLMANPPFAGEIKDQRLIQKYDIANKGNNSYPDKIDRDILFIERNLDMLKQGGRMAVVLPQGRYNNKDDRKIREFISERCRILAVIGLHINTFKPHTTGTKTSVLFVQKWDDEKCPKMDDYPIFFATQQIEGKNNSGEKLFFTKNKNSCTMSMGSALKDEMNHPVSYHDLHNNNGLTSDGIAEAFIEFAKKERLSFF